VVPAGGAKRTIAITPWIVNHVQQGHTYEHYRLIPAIINRDPTSTIVTPPTNAAGIAAAIQHVLGNPLVAAAWPWAGQMIIVGAVQLRIAAVPGGGGNFRVTQFYYYAAPGLGDVVPAAALSAIAQHFPYLVY
jgi:hypothetical protein